MQDLNNQDKGELENNIGRQEIEIEENNKKGNNKKEMPFIFELIIVVAIALFIRFFIFNITHVSGMSMVPTLNDGDILITERVSLFFKEAEIGDVVVIKAPDNSGDNYIKRVIAKSGDKVELKDGEVFVNDLKLDEDYTNYDPTLSLNGETSWVLNDGEYFVMGDNRAHSNDSRAFGKIEKSRVKGISVFRLFPFNRIGKL